MEGSIVSFASEDGWQSRGHVTWSDGTVYNLVAVVAWWKRYLVATDGN